MSMDKKSTTKLLIRLCLAGSALLGSTSMTSAAEIYKTIDENGNVVFSDQPSKEAEKIEVQAPVTFDSSVLTRQYENASKRIGSEEKPPSFKYTRLEITSPANDTAIRDNAGNFEVSYVIEPPAQPGHTVQLMMDGKVHSKVRQSGTIKFENADRGTHVLRLRVIQNSNKKVLELGPVSTVSILRYIPPRAVHH